MRYDKNSGICLSDRESRPEGKKTRGWAMWNIEVNFMTATVCMFAGYGIP